MIYKVNRVLYMIYCKCRVCQEKTFILGVRFQVIGYPCAD